MLSVKKYIYVLNVSNNLLMLSAVSNLCCMFQIIALC